MAVIAYDIVCDTLSNNVLVFFLCTITITNLCPLLLNFKHFSYILPSIRLIETKQSLDKFSKDNYVVHKGNLYRTPPLHSP